MNFQYSTIYLGAAEYAKIVGEINTNYTKYNHHLFAVHASYGVDNVAYYYFFENRGYNDYNIYARIPI